MWIMNGDIECVFVEAFLKKNVTIGVVYRPPDRPIENLNEQLKPILDIIEDSKLPCYLLGDLNLNLLNYETHRETANNLDLLYNNNFVPIINRPTRITDRSASLIDHIMCNNYGPSIKCYQGILLTDISDHYPVFHIAQYTDIKQKKISSFSSVRCVTIIMSTLKLQ